MKKPSHLNQKGEAHMVDISQKEETKRKAKAEGFVKVKKSTIETIKKGNLDKGDLFGSARIAGIMAAKKTSDLIPQNPYTLLSSLLIFPLDHLLHLHMLDHHIHYSFHLDHLIYHITPIHQHHNKI
mgnify:CR=1 FL=1